MTIKYSAILNLHSALNALEIPHEFSRHEFDSEGFHLYYPDKVNTVCSVILTRFSYGSQYGLLEIMGLLTPEEREYDDVVGSLTATEVCKRILEDYIESQKENEE